MKELIIDTGLRQYKLAEDCIVEFNPTDSEFASKLFDVYAQLEEMQKGFKARLEKETDSKEIMDMGKEFNAQIKTVLNGIFDRDICTPICGDVSVYALTDGMPIWAKILLVILDEMNDAFTEEQKKQKTQIEKYTKKYHR